MFNMIKFNSCAKNIRINNNKPEMPHFNVYASIDENNLKNISNLIICRNGRSADIIKLTLKNWTNMLNVICRQFQFSSTTCVASND